MSFYLKIYPPPKQTYENFGDVYKHLEKYIRNSKHTNQTSLMKFQSASAFLQFECYEIYQFGSMVVNTETQELMSSKYAVFRILWDAMEDMQRWRELDPKKYIPNIKIHALEISYKQFKELFDLFTNVKISIWPRALPSNMLGLDGVDYELTFDGYFGIDVTYKWWSETDGTWAALSESAMQAKYLIDTWIDAHEKSQRKP